MDAAELCSEYHQLLGWHIIDDVGALSGFPPDAENWTWIPRLDQSSDLCIAELDRVCKKNGWDLEIIHNFGAPEWEVEVGWISGKDIPQSWFGNGATFNEAALRALIAAHKRESEAV